MHVAIKWAALAPVLGGIAIAIGHALQGAAGAPNEVALSVLALVMLFWPSPVSPPK